MDHRVGDSVSLHHPTPSDFALTGLLGSEIGQWGFSFLGIGFASKITGWGGHRVHPPGPPPSAFVNDVSMGAFFLASGLH